MSNSLPVSRPDYRFAKRHGVLLTSPAEDGVLQLLVRKPGKATAVAEVRRLLQQPVELVFCSEQEFAERLTAEYETQGDAAQMVAADIGDNLDLAALAKDLPKTADLLASDDDAPVIRLINAILTQAVREGASDVHIEPFEQRLSVRFRVDGVLREVLSPAAGLAPLMVSRIKVMADLDIAEKRLPQDGRISLRVADQPIDVRVSTLPSGHGERVVLRLLDKRAGRLSLTEIGMPETMQQTLTDLLQRPHGIVLVTGPTGSGKTTSLYAGLSYLNDRSRNIMTVEDPIEYYLDGIGQTQVNSKVDLSFARGLRAILRQDPDVVMVGEIRDLETAQIAVQASLTGHLVLSTLHTNTAIGSITRLRDMGIEPFLLSSSLSAVIAQRLVRSLDQQWSERYRLSAAELAAFASVAGIQNEMEYWAYRPNPERAVEVSGYQGRSGIYELIVVDEALRGLIHVEAGETELLAAARVTSAGILEDGWNKILQGQTTVDEVLRVTREA